MKFVFAAFLLLTFAALNGQNPIGIPTIINYSKDLYSAGTENRNIVQGRDGVMYFANLEGLLTFDGVFWKLYSLPNKSTVRSLAIGKDDRIYVGGQGDFGYFSPDSSGNLVFSSLKTLLSKEDYSFGNIIHVVALGDDIFFRSREKIFKYSRHSVTTFSAPSEWNFLGVINNAIVAQDLKEGLLKYSEGRWKTLLGPDRFPKGFSISSLVPVGADSLLITSINSGFYCLCGDKITAFQFPGGNPFTNQRILSAISVGTDRIAVGTNLNGCYIIDKKGNVLQNLSRKDGLQLNNILAVFQDHDNNVWLGLDDGIDYISYNSAIKHIYPEKFNEGKGFTSLIFENNLYVGTSNGLYKTPLDGQKDLSLINRDFTYISNTRGANRNLTEINGELLLGHQDGAFKITGDHAVPISIGKEYLRFLPYTSTSPVQMVLGSSNHGLGLLGSRDKKHLFDENIAGFSESAQFVEIDSNGIIWIGNPYRGVYRVQISANRIAHTTLYADKSGLPSAVKNQLFKIHNQVVVATEQGIYQYDAARDRFKPSPYFLPFFGTRNIRYLKEDPSGNIWFVEDKNLGVVDLSGSTPKVIYFPEINGKMVSGSENVYPYDARNVLVGADKGFYHINYEEYKTNVHKLNVKIRTAIAIGKEDSSLFGGYYGEVNQQIDQPKSEIPTICHEENSLHFEYSAPVYAHQSIVQYSYYLKGFDRSWSEWSKKSEKDYTNLSPGSYTFQVRAKNNLGSESEINAYSFRILPPWYQTGWAYLAYALCLAGLVYLLVRWLKALFRRQQQKHEEEQKRLTFLHELEMAKSEREIVKLRNEKLEAEINHKNTELATTAMHLVQKGELLGNIKEVVVRVKKTMNGHADVNEFREIARMLNNESQVDKDWEQFSQHFDHVHNNFLSQFKAAYPSLSARELKLCAYLRMNLSSKEIAQLDGITVRGVEMSRYRLRKKLKIGSEVNLLDYILTFSPNDKQRSGNS